MIIIIIYSGLIRLEKTTPSYAVTAIACVSVHPGPSTMKPCLQSAINPNSCAVYSRVQSNTATHEIKIHCETPPRALLCAW